MTQTKKNVTLKSLPESSQRLILLMNEHQFGMIFSLMIVHGQPMLELADVCTKRRFSQPFERKEVSPNYRLKDSQIAMLQAFDEIYDGTINCIKFANGLPIEMDKYLSN